MKELSLQLLLADDDKDDSDLFKEALDELPVKTSIVTVSDGEQLMHLLDKRMNNLPQVLFLDLNMPRKNGFECLSEIKQDVRLKNLPVIIFSTSFDKDIVDLLYTNGAHFYISKPNEFDKLKEVIHAALQAVAKDHSVKPGRENFVLYP